MLSLIQIIYMAIGLYMWVLVIGAILSWLLIFNIANPKNELVRRLGDVVHAMTEPALRPIRRVIPKLNGVDLSWLVLYFGLMFVRLLIQNNFPIWWNTWSPN